MFCFFMIISGNIMNHICAIQPLNGSNYGSWRETIETALALIEIDLALTADAPKEPRSPCFVMARAPKLSLLVSGTSPL
jgi:hypothetical protein